jgi:NitT/TauT family transport system ATP-binding protein
MQIEIQNLNKSFQGKQILKNISLSIKKGEIVTFLGPSGCGKSTLLRILAGLESKDSGFVESKGEISFVFQQPLLLDWRSALSNVVLPLELKGMPKVEAKTLAVKALALTGLAESLEKYPDQLSGGMEMRVSLARALVTNPEIMLLDEPFAALDEISREKLNEELIELNHQKELTLVFVSHNIFEAVFTSDKIIILGQNPATIQDVIEVKLPKPRRMAERGSPEFAALVGRVQAVVRAPK